MRLSIVFCQRWMFFGIQQKVDAAETLSFLRQEICGSENKPKKIFVLIKQSAEISDTQ